MAEGDLRWKYNVGAKIESVIVTDSNGVIYFGTGFQVPVANDKIIALNPDGSLKWEFQSESVWGFYKISGLCLSNDESVVFVVDGGNNVWALYTADGTQKWMYGYPDPGEDETPGICGIVADADDNVYVGSWCCYPGLFSLDSNGNYRWGIPEPPDGDECHSGHAIGKSNTVIYYLDVDFGLREVQLSDGTVNWTHQGYSWGCWGTGIKIASDGTIYYQDCEYFYAVNPDGSEKWFFHFQDLAYPGAPYGKTNSTDVAIGSDGDIRFGCWHDYAYRVMCLLKSDGTEKWNYPVGSWIGSGFAGTGIALDSNDVLFAGCHDYKLYAINPDGTLRWIYTAGNEIDSGVGFSPSEDTVYFGCDDGYFYAIEKVPGAPTCGIVAVGDKVLLCPIGNRYGGTVALKSGKAATTDKALIVALNNQAALKLDFRNCKSKQGDKVICVPISGAKKNILGLR